MSKKIPEKQGKKRNPPKDTRFKPGVSGNPGGRPKDPYKVLRSILHGKEEEKFVRRTIALAKKGNPAALMVIWKRLCPELPQTHEIKGEVLHGHVLHPELERKLYEIYRISCVNPGEIGFKEGAEQEYPEPGGETPDGVDD